MTSNARVETRPVFAVEQRDGGRPEDDEAEAATD
jgi:hypothetical protein